MDHCGPGSDGNVGVLRIPQSSSIAGTSPSDCLVSYPGHSLEGGSYPPAEKQSVYSTAPVDWAKIYSNYFRSKSLTGKILCEKHNRLQLRIQQINKRQKIPRTSGRIKRQTYHRQKGVTYLTSYEIELGIFYISGSSKNQRVGIPICFVHSEFPLGDTSGA